MSKPDGGPAFARPVSEDRSSGDMPDGNDTVPHQTGMSLRDYFAAHALGGLVANAALLEIYGRMGMADGMGPDPLISARCYLIADAMLAARAK